MMGLQNITLISSGYFENGFLRNLTDAVGRELFLPVTLKEAHMDLSEFYDPSRRQYNANKLLREIDMIYGSDSVKTIVIVNVDIFIPILTFIFGQAYLNGRTAVVSAYRLRNEIYGMEKNDNLYLDRLKKEVIHELGHTLGLRHCHVPMCVMRSVTYVEEIDQKDQSLCRACREIAGL